MQKKRKAILIRPTDQETDIIQKLAAREKRSISNLLIYLAIKEWDQLRDTKPTKEGKK